MSTQNRERGLGSAAAPVGAEAVLRAAPRLIVATGESADREPWESLGVLEPRGPIAFARVGSEIERPSLRAIDALEQLCAAIDAVR